MLKALVCLFCVVVTACTDSGTVRLVAGRSDTVIVNGREQVSLNLALVNAAGAARPAKGVKLQLVSGKAVELHGTDNVKCDAAGDAEMVATRGDLSTRVTVFCRPIASFRLPRVLRLMVGGPPAPLEIGALDVNGEPVDMIAGKASVVDSQVATLADGQVLPRSRGITLVEVEAGDCEVSVPIEVVEASARAGELLSHQYYAESLSVAAGEVRYWRLPPGRYEISLFDGERPPEHLRLASHEMNCAALPRTEQQYSCIAREGAAVIVQHTEPTGRGRETRATLLVQRKADLAEESAAWVPRRPRLYVYRCPLVAR